MQQDIVIAGFGGQGLLFAANVLAQAAMLEGREVAWIPSYGPEMRGGTANCTVIVADRPIGSLVVARPASAIVMNTPSLAKFGPMVRGGGLLLINSSLIEGSSGRSDLRELHIGATQASVDIGSDKLASIVMLGAYRAVTDLVPLESLKQALEDLLPAHRKKLLPMNMTALETGGNLVRALEFTHPAI